MTVSWITNASGVVVVDGSIPTRPADVVRLRYIHETYGAAITKAAIATGVPEAWLVAFIKAESNGVAAAHGGSGEAGLMQLMPELWGGMARAQAEDPEWNVRTGASLLRSRLPCHKWELPAAASSYNCGCDTKNGRTWAPNKNGSALWGMCAYGESYIGNIVAHSNDAIRLLGISSYHADVKLAPSPPVTSGHRSSEGGSGFLVVGALAAAAAVYFGMRK
mgnify:CR=1 FL=1